MRPFCCKPFHIHGHAWSRSLSDVREVTKTLVVAARTLQIHLVTEAMTICAKCRKEIHDRAKQRETAEQEKQKRVTLQQAEIQSAAERSHQRVAHLHADHAIEGAASVSMDIEEDNSGEMDCGEGALVLKEGSFVRKDAESSEKCIEKNELVEALTDILPKIGVPQIMPDKLRTHVYCRKMLEEITTQIATRIFEMPTHPENMPTAQTAEDEFLQQLKDEFSKTNDKERKIKILSVLPRSWSAYKI